MSAIGDESHNPSARPSLTGLVAGAIGAGVPHGQSQGQGFAAAAEEAARVAAMQHSFLDADTLSYLQRDLDLETVECEFDEKVWRVLTEPATMQCGGPCRRYNPQCTSWLQRRVALEEAFRLLPSRTRRRGRLRESPDTATPGAAPGGLLAIPRVFSLRSARFELPLNSAALNCE